MSDVCPLCTAIKKSNFEELERDDFVFIHHQNTRFIAIEIFKVLKGTDPQILKEIFQFRDAVSYQLRTQADFQITYAHSVFDGTKCVTFLGSKNLGNFTS